MFSSLRLRNFKGWADTGEIRIAPLTLFFGRNSSGKSSLLQSLLLMKQTAEALDPDIPLAFGDAASLVELGTFGDTVHRHDESLNMEFNVGWRLQEARTLRRTGPAELIAEELRLQSLLGVTSRGRLVTRSLAYDIVAPKPVRVEMHPASQDSLSDYEISTKNLSLTRKRGRAWPVGPPVKFYGFPDDVSTRYQNSDFLFDLALEFDQLLTRMAYVGPLRHTPQRNYLWGGQRPGTVGPRGENAVEAILAARADEIQVPRGEGKGRRYDGFEQRIADWLKKLDIIRDFKVVEIAPGRRVFEVQVQVEKGGPWVLLPDVGFGVSQVLPVLVQAFYQAEGRTMIFEQPEIHLHPAVQSGLADIFLDSVENMRSQVIIETHSEHLLRRFQRRVAEGDISPKDIAIYVVELDDHSNSIIRSIEVDLSGRIANWPRGFFGDGLAEAMAMAKSGLARRADRGE